MFEIYWGANGPHLNGHMRISKGGKRTCYHPSQGRGMCLPPPLFARKGPGAKCRMQGCSVLTVRLLSVERVPGYQIRRGHPERAGDTQIGCVDIYRGLPPSHIKPCQGRSWIILKCTQNYGEGSGPQWYQGIALVGDSPPQNLSRIDDIKNSFSEPTVYWHCVVNIRFFFTLFKYMYMFTITLIFNPIQIQISEWRLGHDIIFLTSKSEYYGKFRILSQEVVVENTSIKWLKNWRYGMIAQETTIHTKTDIFKLLQFERI